MAEFFDISITGDEALAKKFATVEKRTQKKVLSKAMRAQAKVYKKRAVDRVSGFPVGVVTGDYKQAWRKAKIRVGASKPSLLIIGVKWPTREELGIDPKDKWFYPAALEYGFTSRGNYSPPRPHLRPAVDDHIERDRAALAAEIGRGVTALFAGG